MSQPQPQPQPLASPIQKRAAAKKTLEPRKEPPTTQALYLSMQTRIASNVLGPEASVEDLIACAMLLTYGPRHAGNGPTGYGCNSRKYEVAWLYCRHVDERLHPTFNFGYLDGLKLQQYYLDHRLWSSSVQKDPSLPEPKRPASIGRDCGIGSNCINLRAAPTSTSRSRLTLENLHAWKQDLPLYLNVRQGRAFAQMRKRTNVRRAWVLLRRHARAVNLMAKVTFHWMEQTQMALCAPDGAGRAADAADFAMEF